MYQCVPIPPKMSTRLEMRYLSRVTGDEVFAAKTMRFYAGRPSLLHPWKLWSPVEIEVCDGVIWWRAELLFGCWLLHVSLKVSEHLMERYQWKSGCCRMGLTLTQIRSSSPYGWRALYLLYPRDTYEAKLNNWTVQPLGVAWCGPPQHIQPQSTLGLPPASSGWSSFSVSTNCQLVCGVGDTTFSDTPSGWLAMSDYVPMKKPMISTLFLWVIPVIPFLLPFFHCPIP